MKKVYTWIGLGVLCVCLLLALRYLQTNEPFLTRTQCPAGFTFFSNLKGHSFCCKGTVQDKQCMARGQNTFCGLAPNLMDPRTNRPLPTCIAMMNEIAASTSGKYCTKEMPNYIAPGTVGPSWKDGGCSVLPAAGDGSMYPFGSDGKTLATPACFISGKKGIADIMEADRNFLTYEWKSPSCETLNMKEKVKCPSGMAVQYDQHNYIRCVSSSAYDPNRPGPGYCYADEIIALLPGLDLEKAKTSCISCSYYKKRYMENDTTAKCTHS